MKEVIVREQSLFSSRDSLDRAIEDSREMLYASLKNDSHKIIVETALHLIVNTIANNYRLYEVDSE
tara:strand:- start:343 stop:540 length:198 start_codon:yes stop_codon:yes gene_type:complete